LEEARSTGQISDDTAEDITDKLDTCGSTSTRTPPHLAKRVRDVTKKIDDLQKDDHIDPGVAQNLKDILSQLGTD
jgi:hypothetical protein